MNDYEWRTEEDEPWPEKPLPPVIPKSGRRLWPFVLLMLLLATTAVILVARQARRQVAVAESTAADDVRHAFNLAQQAAGRGDAELYTSLLDARDASWVAAQQELVEQGVIGDRSFAGLAPHAAGREMVDVILAPDFMAAELLWRQTFSVDIGAGVSGTATFEYLDFYRYREGRWLLSPPPADFWGPWQTTEGQFLTLIYPQRDVAIGRRLAWDLDAMVAALCRQFEGAAECRSGGKVQLRLGTEANRLLQMALRLTAPMSGSSITGPARQIDLPAPTLLGYPVDETGYQALYAAYGRYLARLMSTNIWNRQREVDTYQSRLAVEKLLLEMGLRTWPPAAAVAARAQQTALPVPAPELAVLCAATTGQGNDLHRYNPGTGRWQPVLAGGNIYQMTAAGGGRAVILAGQPFLAGEPRRRVTLYSGHGAQILFDQAQGLEAGRNAPVVRVSEPSASRLLLRLPDEQNEPTWHYLDVPACLAGDCRLAPAGDYHSLQWAPGGAHTLFLKSEGQRLRMYLGDGQGIPLQELDFEQAVWLSAGEYAGVDLTVTELINIGDMANSGISGGEASPLPLMLATSGAVLLSSVAGEAPRTLVTAADLLAIVAAEEWPLQFKFAVTSVQSATGRSDMLLIHASGFLFGAGDYSLRSYLFLADTDGAARLLWSGTMLSTVAFSPDGRWLAWIKEDNERQLALYEVAENAFHTVAIGPAPFFEQILRPSFHWSANGRWLVVAHDNLLYLVAPDYGHRQIVIPEAPGCTQAAWIE